MNENHISIRFATSVYIIILFFSILWCSFLVLAPVFQSLGGILGYISNFIYWFYSPVCHQDDARSFFIFGDKFAVCSRCSMIYFSFLLGTILYPFLKRISDVNLPSVWFLIVASLLMLIDVALDIFDVHKNTNLTRSITGFILGFVLVFYLIPGFINFSYEIYTYLKFNRNNRANNEQ